MAIFKRLQMLARAERSARRPQEHDERLLSQQRDALKSSLDTLRRDDQEYYQKLQRLREELDAIEQRAIDALHANDEPAARRELERQAQLNALKNKIIVAREVLAAQLASSEQTLEALQKRLNQRPATASPTSTPNAGRADEPPYADSRPSTYDEATAAAPKTATEVSPRFEGSPYASAGWDSSYPQTTPTERTAPSEAIPRETPAYPQAEDRAPSQAKPYTTYRAEELPASNAPDLDGGLTDGSLAKFDAMERKIVEMEARAELSSWTPAAPRSSGEILEQERDDDRWGQRTPPDQSVLDDPLADPLLEAFDDLEAAENAKAAAQALEDLKAGTQRESDDALAALRKRMRGE